MNSSKITLSVLGVVAVLAIAAVGIGFAFQASFTDVSTEESAATGQYLKVADGHDPEPLAVDKLSVMSDGFYVNAGIEIDASGDSPTYAWDVTGIKVTTDAGATEELKKYTAVKETAGEIAGTITVKALFYYGAYSITTPQSIDDATITADVTYTAPATGTIAPTIKTYLTDTALTELQTSAEITVIDSAVLDPEEAAIYYVYVQAEWSIPAPDEGTDSVMENLLGLGAYQVKVIASAENFATE